MYFIVYCPPLGRQLLVSRLSTIVLCAVRGLEDVDNMVVGHRVSTSPRLESRDA